MTHCPYCEAMSVTPLVCTSCKSLLPLEESPSPFEALGLEAAWDVDTKELKKKLLQLSRLMHPDYFASADADTRERAERASATLNESYEILASDVARADLLVRDLGGPSDAEERQMPKAFLMQVMEWNEAVEDAHGAAANSPERIATEELTSTLRDERRGRLEAVGALLTPLPSRGAAELTEVRRQLNVVRYIDRIQAELKSLRLAAASGE